VGSRGGGTSPRSVRGVAALAAGLVIAAVLAGGCATLPSSGQPQSFAVRPPQGGGTVPGSKVLVQPPQRGWPPSEVVRDFLLASTNAAHNYHMAREYLTFDASKGWHPGSQVTILSNSTLHVFQESPRLNGTATVVVTWRELATLSGNGQYIPASAAVKPSSESFVLQPDSGTYKITKLPTRVLLLTSGLFHQAYTPQDIYYYGRRSGLLLPDPVYAPIQGTNPVTTLVNDLRHNPAGLLGGGAARTYLPEDARLTGVQVSPGPSGKTAIVNITLPHGGRGADVPKMAAQLVSTLTSPVFSPALFHMVRLRIDGHLWPPENLASFQGAFPRVQRDLDLYYLAQNGSIRVLGPAERGGRPLPNSSGVSQPALRQVAVSPDQRHLAGISKAGTTVYTGVIAPATKPGQSPTAEQLQAQLTGRKFTSLSWDRAGDLWIASGKRNVWKLSVLIHGQGTPTPVNDPFPSREPITAVRVAPDGVRVALVAGGQVWLAAAYRVQVDQAPGGGRQHNPGHVVPPGPTGGFSLTQPVPLGGQVGNQVLTAVTSLTWYDEDHLLAVAGRPTATQLYEVPVDGDNPTSLGALSGNASVTAAGTGGPYYLGLPGGHLDRAGPNTLLQVITAGQAPSYPG
jgi:hypothetical protein